VTQKCQRRGRMWSFTTSRSEYDGRAGLSYTASSSTVSRKHMIGRGLDTLHKPLLYPPDKVEVAAVHVACPCPLPGAPPSWVGGDKGANSVVGVLLEVLGIYPLVEGTIWKRSFHFQLPSFQSPQRLSSSTFPHFTLLVCTIPKAPRFVPKHSRFLPINF